MFRSIRPISRHPEAAAPLARPSKDAPPEACQSHRRGHDPSRLAQEARAPQDDGTKVGRLLYDSISSEHALNAVRRANMPSGKDGFGSTPLETKTTLRGTSITFISI